MSRHFGRGQFSGLFSYWDRYGITEVIIPFILIFTVLFAVLQRVKIFGADSKKYNVIISLAIAVISIIPHSTGLYQEFDIVQVINTSLPQIGLIIIGIVMLMILLGLVSGKDPSSSSVLLGFAGLFGVILLVVVFWRALFPFQSPVYLSFLDDPNLQALLIVFAVFGLIVWFVTKEPGGQGKGLDNIKKGLKDLFGGS